MLSDKFTERMRILLGTEADDYFSSLDAPRARALHLNRAKGCAKLPFSTKPISYFADGFYFDEEKPGLHPLHHAGAYYIQEPSAMAPVSALEGTVCEKARILDVCASPGGKTSQVSNLFRDAELVVSNEIVPNRCKTLVGNVERLGFRKNLCLNTDTRTLSLYYPEYFSIVICDAPCSGEGMFRKSDDAKEMWSEENVKLCAARQREILSHIRKCVAPNGYLLYSTCTFSPEENEENVSIFLEENPDFSLCEPGEKFDSCSRPGFEPYCRGFEPRLVRRFYPHISGGEGQFFALFKRADVEPTTVLTQKSKRGEKPSLRELDKKELSTATSFLNDTLGYVPSTLAAYGENILIVPDGIRLPEKHIFSCGVKLGELRSGRIVPHHQFFSAYGGDFLRKVDFSSESEKIERYLRGECFDVSSENGFCAVTVDGIALGGGKVVDGFLKNYYPKGLRKNG